MQRRRSLNIAVVKFHWCKTASSIVPVGVGQKKLRNVRRARRSARGAMRRVGDKGRGERRTRAPRRSIVTGVADFAFNIERVAEVKEESSPNKLIPVWCRCREASTLQIAERFHRCCKHRDE